MTTTFLLIRHGQTDWNLARRWQGHYDMPLNTTGLAQAQALANRLADWPVTALYTSDLQRAAMTAKILGTAWQLAPQIELGLRERDVGVFSGLTSSEARSQHPEAWSGNGSVNPPQGETLEAVQQRAVKTFDSLLARHSGTEEMVAVVSHGGLLYMLISQILGVTSEPYGRFRLSGNTGLSIVEVNEHRPVLTLLNDISHLEQPLPDNPNYFIN